jgi:hypothetical protein
MTSSAPLQRHFRRLLRAYPSGYRRRHGDEILTTLMDTAGPGRQRPTAHEVRDLLTSGLRQRFRLPVGRLMLLGALLTAATAGALGVAAGSAAGWATARSQPTDSEFRELLTQTTGTAYRGARQTDDGMLGLQRRTFAADSLWLAHWTPEAATTRLTAAGWHVDPLETSESLGASYQSIGRPETVRPLRTPPPSSTRTRPLPSPATAPTSRSSPNRPNHPRPWPWPSSAACWVCWPVGWSPPGRVTASEPCHPPAASRSWLWPPPPSPSSPR